MVDRLDGTKALFAQAETLHELINLLTPSLSECLGGGQAGDVRAVKAVYLLAHLGERVFSFDLYRDESFIFDYEELLSKQRTGEMLDALKSGGIIYRKKGKYSIRRDLYYKLSWLHEIDVERQCEEILESI